MGFFPLGVAQAVGEELHLFRFQLRNLLTCVPSFGFEFRDPRDRSPGLVGGTVVLALR